MQLIRLIVSLAALPLLFTPAAGGSGSGPMSANACILIRQTCITDANPQWSPDGRRIAFYRSAPVDAGIYSVPAAGGDPQRIFAAYSLPGEQPPSLSPDWSKVAFRFGAGLRVANVDGSDPHDVSAEFAPFDWAPNGQRLAYSRQGHLFVSNADGSGSRDLGSGAQPDWSPDGRQLAFIDAGSMLVIRADGTGRRVLYGGEAARGRPSWSPDGSQLAVSVLGSVTLIALDGRLIRTFDGLGVFGSPTWSHDGSLIAAEGGRGIATFSTVTGVMGSYRGANPAWSPVANDLAAVHDGPCVGFGVRLIAVESGSSRRLTLDCHFWGTPGDDRIDGTSLIDVIAGLAGDDELAGEGDSDIIHGGRGNDRLNGGGFGDVLQGGPGNDLVHGGVEKQDTYAGHDDFLSGGPGADRLRGGPGLDTLNGDAGNDELRAGDDSDVLHGGPGNDRLFAWGDPEPGFGGRSRDTVDCGSGRHDVAYVDRRDRVLAGCEVVRRR